jgi:predicted Zn-dependent peptidase
MQKSAALLLLVLVVVSLTAPEASARKTPWEKFKYPDLGEIQLPSYERVELANGMVLYLTEDHELPMVELSATIQAGAIYEPAELTGLASITGEVLRTGGTANRTGDEIDELVESMGAAVETWIGQTQGGAYMSALKEDADTALEILADILMNPQFADEKIDIAKTSRKAGIARRNDEPMSIARREFTRVMFGPDHPMARIEEYDSINSISRDHLVEFHNRFFHPDRMWLVVIGDFDKTEMVAKIEAAFAGWEKASEPLPADPEIPALPRTVNVAPKDDLTQSTVILGIKGVRNDHPQYAAIQVANRILGGGFSSRLFNEVRSARGLAYSTGSAPGTGWRFPGTFVAFAGTKNETAEQAATVILDEIARMSTEPVTEKELEVAVDGILNSDVFNYDTKREVLDRMVVFEMNGYENDFLTKYRSEVQNMTAEKVMAAAGELWTADDMSILAVGNPADFDGDMSKFGPVNEIDITIPEPEMTLEVPAATPETLARGQELMGLAMNAMSSKIAGMKGFASESSLDLNIQGMDLTFGIETVVALPGRMKSIQKTPFGEMSQVLDGENAWAVGPMGKQEVPAEDMREELKSNLVLMLRDRAELTCQALEPADVDGVMCERVYITGLGDDFVLLCLEQASHRPFMEQSKGQDPVMGGPVVQKVFYSDWKDFGGVSYFGSFEIRHDDEHFAAGTTKSFSLNPTIGADTFQ